MDLSDYTQLSLRELQLKQLELMKQIHMVCIKHDITYYMIGGTLLGAVRHKGFIPWDDDIDIAMPRKDFERFKEKFDAEFDRSAFLLQDYSTDKHFQPALTRVCFTDTTLPIASEEHLHHFKHSYLDIFPLDNVPDDEVKSHKHERKLKLIDRVIALKAYHVYPNNNRFEISLKKAISKLLGIIPLSTLQKMRVREMCRYDKIETKRICSTVSHYGYRKQVMDKEIYGKPTLLQFEDTEFFAPEKYGDYLTHLFGRNYMKLPPIEKRDKPKPVYARPIKKKYSIGYTSGVFDMFHVGHLNILKQAKAQCDFLIVAVSTDELVESYKHKTPIIPFPDRVEIIRSTGLADRIVAQENRDKVEAFRKFHFDAMFVGDDWKNSELFSKVEIELKNDGVTIVYFPYTQKISSTILRNKIQSHENHG